MAIRKDGIHTRDQLLKAATEVFAERGYRKTTIAEICRRAHSNVAAVNYHFGSKDALYMTVWKNAFAEAMKIYPPDGGLGPEAPAEEKLRAMIYAMLHRILDNGRLGCGGQILLREMGEPTIVIEPVFQDMINPLRQRLQQVVSDLLGPRATPQEVRFCGFSVVHQCLAIGFRKTRKKLPPLFLSSSSITMEMVNRLVDHVTLFSLAGIAAVRNRIESSVSSGKVV